MSFPLLEDISLTTFDCIAEGDDVDGQLITVQPSTSPPFTGSLRLVMWQGMIHFAPWLLFLPNGLHFWKLDLTWNSTKDVSLTTALVEECHSTLESLRINDGILCMSSRRPCAHKWLTAVCSPAAVSADQPREGDKTQRCSIYVPDGPSMDFNDTSNHHA